MKLRQAASLDIRCSTIGCQKPKCRKNGKAHSAFCQSCKTMRRRAKVAGINPFSLTRQQLEQQFWEVREEPRKYGKN